MKVSLLFNLLFGCCITLMNARNLTEEEGEAKVDLYVLTILPYIVGELLFQPSLSIGPELYIALELAADTLNSRIDILDGYQLKLLQENGGCDVPFRSIEGLVRGLSLGKDDPPIVGMIGPSCSISSTAAATFNGRKEVSLLNIYSGGTPEISNRTRYPFSFGILDSVEVIAKALVALIKFNSWKNISVFHVESRLYFSSLSRAFNSELSKYNKDLRRKGSAEVRSEMRDVLLHKPFPVKSVQNMNRIVIFMVDEDLLKKMLCVLHHIGLRYPNYLFIMAGLEAFNPSKVITIRNITCTSNIIESILATSVLIDYQLESSDDKEIKFSNFSLGSFKERYKQRIMKVNSVSNSNIQLSREGAMYFDGLWSLALALNNSIGKVNLTTYKFLNQQHFTKIISSELLKLDYEGLSGRIRFNKTTGRVEQNVSISLINKNQEIKIAYYTKISDEIKILKPVSFTDIFIMDKFTVKFKTAPKPLIYVILTLAVIALLVTAILHTLIIVYRERKPVKATSVKLNWMAFISCYSFMGVMILNVYIHGFSDKITPMSICTLQHVFDTSFSVGLTLLFGTACLHRWRLYKLLVHYTNPGKFLSDNVLVGGVFGMVIVDLLLVVPPVFIDRYEPDFKDITPEENTEAVLTKIMVCNRKNYFLWFFFGIIESIVLMIVILIFTIKTRKISHKHFTAKWTVCQLYSLSIILSIFLGLCFIFYYKRTYSSIISQFVNHSFLMLSLLIISNLIIIIPLLQTFQESKFYLRQYPPPTRISNRHSFYSEHGHYYRDAYRTNPSIVQRSTARKLDSFKITNNKN